MPSRYMAQLRHARYYQKVAAVTEEELYLKGEQEA
jgi:hypothetical protein